MYPIDQSKLIAKTSRGFVVALNVTQVAKALYHNSFKELELEAEKMRLANSVNNLVVKFVDLKKANDDYHLLIMERIYPLELRAFDWETRMKFADEFEQKMKELHVSGLVYMDLVGITMDKEDGNLLQYNRLVPKKDIQQLYANSPGIRLADMGIALQKDDIGEQLFKQYLLFEQQAIYSVRMNISQQFFDYNSKGY